MKVHCTYMSRERSCVLSVCVCMCERERERRSVSSRVRERGCACQTFVRKRIMKIRKTLKKPKRRKKSKRMSRIIHERMQTFAYVHQIGRMRILGTVAVIPSPLDKT